MNYATWKLNFTDPDYGTGPEEKIASMGFFAEGAWSLLDDQVILGYVSEAQDEKKLSNWQFKNIDQTQALELVLEVEPLAFLTNDGKITKPIEEPGI
jgi:hypothetical protein